MWYESTWQFNHSFGIEVGKQYLIFEVHDGYNLHLAAFSESLRYVFEVTPFSGFAPDPWTTVPEQW